MFGSRVIIKRGGRDDGERPFWISFADMMTALMVLFLLVMSVALLAVTKTISDAERKRVEHDRQIDQLLTEVAQAATRYPGVHVDRSRRVVDFGDRARFDTGSSALSPSQASLLRTFVPEVLTIAHDPLGQRWLKQIVVEGFTDQHGAYLYNLNLSLQRSQRVLCVLLAKPLADERPMSAEHLQQIRKLFLVGGYSFNSAKESDGASRRIELRLEFLAVDERPPTTAPGINSDTGVCAI
jgi:outer membrane protein OmpA-like peptidoglycan-associated protein